jgi:Ni2+-binding GTPase involved in maturation of urease and hydrogenase
MRERFCNICGNKLQSAHPGAIGYVPNRVLLGTSSSVCQRCHRARIASVPAGRNQEVASGGVRRVLEKADLSLLVIDITDFEGTFSKRLLRHCGRKLMLVVNKIDLLPGRISRSNILAWVTRRLADAHVDTQGVFPVSMQKGSGVTTLWDAVIKELNGQGVVTVVGVEGVGKTALVNSWLEYNKAQAAKKKKTRRKSMRGTSDDKADTTVTLAQADGSVAKEPERSPSQEHGIEREVLREDQPGMAKEIPSKSESEPIIIIEQPALFDLIPSRKPDVVVSDDAVPESMPLSPTEQRQEDRPQTTVKPQEGKTAPMPIDDIADSDAADSSGVKAVSPRPKKRRRSYATRRRAKKPAVHAQAPDKTAADAATTEGETAASASTAGAEPVPVPTPPFSKPDALSQQAENATPEPKPKVKSKRSRRRKAKKPGEKTGAQPPGIDHIKSDAAKAAPHPNKTKKGKTPKQAERSAKTSRVGTEPVAEVIATQSESAEVKAKSSRRRSRRRRTVKPVPTKSPVVSTAVASEVKQLKAEHEPATSAQTAVQVQTKADGKPAAAIGKAPAKPAVEPKPETLEIKVIDTLSVPARGRMRDSLCAQCTMDFSIQKPLRSRVIRLKAGQGAVFAGLVAIAVLEIADEDDAASLLIYMPPAITVQRVPGTAIDEFLQGENRPWRMDVCAGCMEHLLQGGWEETEMSVDALHDLALHGMGWLTVRKSTVTMRVLVPVGMLASMRPRLLGVKA